MPNSQTYCHSLDLPYPCLCPYPYPYHHRRSFQKLDQISANEIEETVNSNQCSHSHSPKLPPQQPPWTPTMHHPSDLDIHCYQSRSCSRSRSHLQHFQAQNQCQEQPVHGRHGPIPLTSDENYPRGVFESWLELFYAYCFVLERGFCGL